MATVTRLHPRRQIAATIAQAVGELEARAVAIAMEHARAAAFVVDDGSDPDAPIPYALSLFVPVQRAR